MLVGHSFFFWYVELVPKLYPHFHFHFLYWVTEMLHKQYKSKYIKISLKLTPVGNGGNLPGDKAAEA
jgi:hypothetical protein